MPIWDQLWKVCWSGRILYNMFTTVVAPPLPLLVIMCILAAIGVMTAVKTTGSEST